MKTHYAYIHAVVLRASVTPFYVGKGAGRRAYTMAGRNRLHRSVMDTVPNHCIGVAVLPCSSEDIAFDLEAGLLKCFRRMGVQLANINEYSLY